LIRASALECVEAGGDGLDPSGTCRFCGEDDYGEYTVPNYWDGLDGCYDPDGYYVQAGTIRREQ
jgi:hypothetical protein